MLVIKQLFGEFDGEEEGGIVGSDDFIFGNSAVVFAGEETPSEGAPPNQAKFVVGEKFFVFDFKVSSDKHVVLILAADGFVEVVFLADGKGVENHFGFPVAGGPVVDQTFLDNFVIGSADFFEGGVVVVEVGVEDVD